jgi:hypothetical protein
VYVISWSVYLSCDTFPSISSSMMTLNEMSNVTNQYLESFFNITSLASSSLGEMSSLGNLGSNDDAPKVSSASSNFVSTLVHDFFSINVVSFGGCILVI